MGKIDTSLPLPRGALTGRRVREHVLGGVIGRGGFAEVYEVEPSVGERLAVKAILVRSGQAEAIGREIDALQVAQHPNILRYLWHERGAGDLEGYVFVATERCEASLAGALDGVPPGEERIEAAWAIVPRLVNDALSGLLHLHGLTPGVIHRDVKPDNILLSPSGVWRMADLGIAKVLDPDESVAIDPTAAFTPGFMAPDLVRRGELTVAADIFGLGASVQWAFTGVQPWPALSIYALIDHVRRNPPLLSPAVPVEWQPFVAAALEVDPRIRQRWSYPSLISWQRGNTPAGRRAERDGRTHGPRSPDRPVRRPSARPTVDAGAPTVHTADRATTVVQGAGPTVIAPDPVPDDPAPRSPVRTAVLRGVVTFVAVLIGLTVLIIARHRP